METIYRSKFVVTFTEDVPVHLENGFVSKRADLKSLHEEANI